MPDRTTPNSSTRREQDRDAGVTAGSDREPTPDEARAAERGEPLDPDVAAHYEAMTERGANQPGEGRVP